jgi:hypothetical protein
MLTPSVIQAMTPDQRTAMAQSLANILGTITTATSLSAQNPMLSDQTLNYNIELQTFETALPANPDDIRYSEELTPQQWGLIAAKDYAAKQNAKYASDQVQNAIDAMVNLMTADTSTLEAGGTLQQSFSVRDCA